MPIPEEFYNYKYENDPHKLLDLVIKLVEDISKSTIYDSDIIAKRDMVASMWLRLQHLVLFTQYPQ